MLMFHYTVTTTKSVDEAIVALEETLKERKFGILWNFDLTAKLQEKGVDFSSPYRILEVCNPQQAGRVVNRELEIGYFLPCKIAVYKDGVETRIGLPKPTVLIGDASSDSALHEVAEQVETDLIAAIDAAK